MDSFAQILRRLPTSDTSSSSRGATPFKVQINFDIPIFEGQIDTDVVDKWLNLLEVLGKGVDPGFNATTMHQQNPNY
jgi:hypothetical protein